MSAIIDDLFLCGFVCFVKTFDYLVSNVVSLVSVKDVVSSLAQDERISVVLVIYVEETVDAVAKSLVVLLLFLYEVVSQLLL